MRASLSGKQQRVQAVDGVSGFLEVACSTRDAVEKVVSLMEGMAALNKELLETMKAGIEEAKKGQEHATKILEAMDRDLADRQRR